ncbi:putative mitochondrial protein, partial [Nicotiana attenuata]
EMGMYLGLPAIVGRSKKKMLEFIKDRLKTKIKGWKGKFLSTTRKEVMLKSVLAAIPTYALSCFQLLDGLCKEITSLSSNFWWGQTEDKRKMHFLFEKWIKMQMGKIICDSKSRGGLGFRDLKAFNMALLAKQAWCILSYPDSLLARVLKSKYFPHSTFRDASTSSTGSWIWRSILWGKDLLVTGLRWRISDGKNINVWTDSWIPRNNGFTPKSIQMQNNLDHKVADLIDEDTH